MAMALTPYEPSPQVTLRSLRTCFADKRLSVTEQIPLALTVLSVHWDKPLSETMIELYQDMLSPYPTDQVERAFVTAIERDTFWPVLARMRELCGAPTAAQEAKEALAWCLAYIRNYGVEGRSKPPVVHSKLVDGREQLVTIRPAEHPPDIHPLLFRTLTLLGLGEDHRNGLACLASHPGLSKWETEMRMEPCWVAEKLEERFASAFERARVSPAAGAGQVQELRANPGRTVPPVREGTSPGSRHPRARHPVTSRDIVPS